MLWLYLYKKALQNATKIVLSKFLCYNIISRPFLQLVKKKFKFFCLEEDVVFCSNLINLDQ